MIITNDRTELDQVLSDRTNTLMLLFGQDTLPQQVHDLALKAAPEAWRKTFLLIDPKILSEQERAQWFKGADKYVTLSKAKAIVENESLEKLCKSGKPLVRLIQIAFGNADQ